MADEPLIAWDNPVDGGIVIAENGASISAGLPVANITTWDNLKPTVFTPLTTSLNLLVGFDQPTNAADTLILGAARHDAAGNRGAATTISLDYHAGAGTVTNAVNAATVAAVNKASLHKFTQVTVTPDSWASRTAQTINVRRVRYLMGRYYTCGADAGASAAINYCDGLGNNSTSATITDTAVVRDIAHDGISQYVAVGSTGKAYLSTDSTTFTNQTIAAAVNMNGIAYGNGVFVAVTNASSTAVYTSPDGTAWTARTLPAAVTSKNVAFSGALFVLVGDAGLIQTSTDGITWTARTSGTANNLTDIIYSGVWVAVSASGDALTSNDGITWTVTASAGGATVCNHITFADGEFKAGATVGGSSQAVIRSNDGVAWTSELCGVGITSIASNGITDFVEGPGPDTAARCIALKSAYRITINGLTAGAVFSLPELYLGARLEMPFVDFNYDPYIEKFQGNTFNSESGRQFTTLHYRRVEVNPNWAVVTIAKAVEVDLFREDHLELRKPFWWAWYPDTAPTECYMMRHNPNTAPMPIRTAVHRSFGLKLIEAL